MEEIFDEYKALLPKNLCVSTVNDLTPREKAILAMIKTRDDQIEKLRRNVTQVKYGKGLD